MSTPLPYNLPTTSGWRVADWLDRSYSSDPAAGGVTTITVPALPGNERWQLTHMVAACTSAADTRMRLYLDGVAAAGLRDGSSAGNFDIADWPLGLWVPPNRSLIAQWTGCDAGAIATLTVQATIYRAT